MEIKTKYMTRNDCYTAGKKINPKGIMVHSTATPGRMAAAWFDRWNKSYKAGETDRQVCVHAFLDDKEVWQYLPWDHRGWHAGSGKSGSANDTHIGFEICEPPGFSYSGGAMSGYDAEKQEAYFRAVWAGAAALCIHLCRLFGLGADDIICHSEGHAKGIASNHADVMHWFPKHNESMDSFRAVVRAALEAAQAPQAPAEIRVGEIVNFTGDTHYSNSGSLTGKKTKAGLALVTAIARGKRRPYHLRAVSEAGKYVSGVYGWVNEKDVAPRGQSAVPAAKLYTVKKGDTLWAIAKKELGSGQRHTEIMEQNGLKSTVIHAGQTLKIPVK